METETQITHFTVYRLGNASTDISFDYCYQLLSGNLSVGKYNGNDLDEIFSYDNPIHSLLQLSSSDFLIIHAYPNSESLSKITITQFYARDGLDGDGSIFDKELNSWILPENIVDVKMTDEDVYDPATSETTQYFLATDANGEHVRIEFKTTNGGHYPELQFV